MEHLERFADHLGPVKVVEIYQPGAGLKAAVVIDNVAAGPAIGGVRMAPDVSVAECFRLARAMTLKNAAAGLRHGGGKAVIAADHRMPAEEKENLIRAFASAIGDLSEYIAGPDMGTDESCMAFIQDEIGRSVGLPREIGGIPLDVIGATGLGLSVAAEVAQGHCEVKLEGARVAIQGFGFVGTHAARFLEQKGAMLVAAADSSATVSNPNGLDTENLMQFKKAGGRLGDYKDADTLPRDAVIGVDCDIWIPAARPDAIRADNADQLKAKLVIEGANIPVAEDAEAILHERGVLTVPDFIANAGGVICAAVEYAGGSETSALQTIEDKIRVNTAEVLETSSQQGITPREAAFRMAEERVRRAMALRRWY